MKSANSGARLCIALVAGAAALIALLAVAACRPGPRAQAPGDVILISIDTLRADHLGCYGYARPTSPRIDAFRRDAVLFTETIAPSSSTLVSHASMMTSLLPQQHGASYGLKAPLAERWPTLASTLLAAGYRTAAFTEGGQIAPAFGLGHGFEEYRAPYAKRFNHVVDRAIAWLDAHPEPKRFLFLHSYEVHHPYSHARRFVDLFDPDYHGPLDPNETSVATLLAINDGRLHIDGRDLAHIVATYDAGIRSMDEAFGYLMDYLKQRGRYDGALIVFTSDHGEELAEHGKVGWHSHTLYDELLHVPLLVKYPGARDAGRRVAPLTRTIDIAPTILAALGLRPPAEFRGADLTPLVEGAPGEAPRIAVSRMDSLPTTSVRSGSWKLYDGRLFDLRQDPRETSDVAARHPDIVRGLATRGDKLIAEVAPAGSGPTTTLDEEARKQLEALGYAH